MNIQAKLLCAFAATGFAALVATAPAQALTTQECSAKYQAAKAAGTLAGQKWNDFRKAQCGADAGGDEEQRQVGEQAAAGTLDAIALQRPAPESGEAVARQQQQQQKHQPDHRTRHRQDETTHDDLAGQLT